MEKEQALEEIRQRLLAQKNILLQDTATNLVFGKGNPKAPIVFVGEAPGAKEDLEGIPFVGAAGRELDKLLQLINLSLDEVYIANILKYRPPDNRDPNVEEIRQHTPYLLEQLQVIQPKVVVTLGNFSTKFLLAACTVEGMKQVPGIMQLHGKVQKVRVGEQTFHVVPFYHPAAMLYRPQLREVLAEDMKKLASFLEGKDALTRFF